MAFLFSKINKGTNTKATRYQDLAKKNFNEMTQSVEKGIVTSIHVKLNKSKTTNGCLILTKISEGLEAKYARNKAVVSHMIGSSGRSVERDELKLYSIDHGRENISR